MFDLENFETSETGEVAERQHVTPEMSRQEIAAV